MSSLKRPEIWGKGPTIAQGQENAQSDNNQEKVITAKLLDGKESSSLGDEETKSLGDQDTLLQSVQETSIQNTKTLNIPGAQDIIPQISQETEKTGGKSSKSLGVQTPKRQKAQKLGDKTPKLLEAEPLDVQAPSQLEVKQLGANSSDLPVDETLNQPDVEVVNQLDAKATKKKAKSATLIKKTYYIDADIDGAIELMAVLKKSDQSDIVRNLLRGAIPDYYLAQWKSMSSDHSK